MGCGCEYVVCGCVCGAGVVWKLVMRSLWAVWRLRGFHAWERFCCFVLFCIAFVRLVRPWLACYHCYASYESGSGLGVGVDDDPRLTNPGVVIATLTSVVGWWFDRERVLANGCAAPGAPLGGILLSLVLQIHFGKYPWKANYGTCAGSYHDSLSIAENFAS